MKKKKKKYKDSHRPSPLHTRRLKSQHHEIITTFLFSTPRYELALGVESFLLYTSLPSGLSLWAFFTLGDGFRLLDDVSSPYPALALPRLEHLHGRQPCYLVNGSVAVSGYW